MGRKCNVLDCPSDSRRPEDNGVTFHKMPIHTDLRPKWIELCRIPEERQINKVIYVCSRHFRRTDFCNFKGTKYMLKQGALPSVFPWTRNTIRKADKTASSEIIGENKTADSKPDIVISEELDAGYNINGVKPESENDNNTKSKRTASGKKRSRRNNGKSKSSVNGIIINSINFTPGIRIEVNDFNGKWYAASILEVDQDENEVLLEFDKHLNRVNEWIPMDSSRLRPYQSRTNTDSFAVGERVMATWTETTNKFPATVKRVLEGDSYEVLFDDGFSKVLKHHKMTKIRDKNNSVELPVHASPLFDPVVGSKEDRRERKRKLNVAELFGMAKKKPKIEEVTVRLEVMEEDKPRDDNSKTEYGGGEWTCRWLNGEPIGTEAVLECNEGPRRSIVVPDIRLPTGWEKHISQRVFGSSAGKWDIILVNPDGKKFHNRQTLKAWIEESKYDCNIEQFDFSLHLNRIKKLGLYEVTDPEALAKVTHIKSVQTTKNKAHNSKAIASPAKSVSLSILTPESTENEDEEESPGSLKIIMESNGYKCPIEGCGKNFRKENLAQMHIKHYHPEYTKFIGTTPNVADLAYARTVGESIDDIVPKTKQPTAAEREKITKTDQVSKQKVKTLLAKTPSKSEESSQDSVSLPSTQSSKDSEIIKLLNSEPKSSKYSPLLDSPPEDDIVSNDSKQEVKVSNLQHHLLAMDKYPVIKLEDLLQKETPLPHKKEENRPGGIKTLLPVVRNKEIAKSSEPETETDTSKSTLQSHKKKYRKRVSSEDDARQKRKYPRYDSDELSTESTDTLKLLEKTNRRLSNETDSSKKRQLSYRGDTDDVSDCGEADSRSQDSFKNSTPTEPLVANTPINSQDSANTIIEEGEVIRLVHMRSEEIINCTCGVTEEDGLMIQCELCLCWQHGHCHNIEKENQVPEKYICVICKNPKNMRPTHKHRHDQDWIKSGVLPAAKYHIKNEDDSKSSYEKLRQTHEIAGCLEETKEYLHALKVKLSIAQNSNHQKLYLWARPWTKDKPQSLLRLDLNQSNTKEIEQAQNDKNKENDIDCMLSMSQDKKIESEKELISILEDGDDLKSMVDLSQSEFNKIMNCNFAGKVTPKESTLVDKKESKVNKINSGVSNSGPLDVDIENDFENLNQISKAAEIVSNAILPSSQNSGTGIPEPEEAIESSDCQRNLLSHIDYYQNLMEDRLNQIEETLTNMEEQETSTTPEEEHSSTQDTLEMLVRDLELMSNLASLSRQHSE